MLRTSVRKIKRFISLSCMGVMSYIYLPGIMLCTGCGALPGDDQAGEGLSSIKIDRIDIDPNPATANDTITFKIVLEDSLQTGLEYRWTFTGKDTVRTVQISTHQPFIQRVLNVPAGAYGGLVIVDDPRAVSSPASRPFGYTIR